MSANALTLVSANLSPRAFFHRKISRVSAVFSLLSAVTLVSGISIPSSPQDLDLASRRRFFRAVDG